ncbi:MAG: transposase family protein [Actinophytocola sp.]|uniref:integrase catalytic domain-containing protein n=1 Tax=Actinophytocola sp. TaxID=1872138 RepID=UPI003C75CE3D
MSQRKAVARQLARRYRSASKVEKAVILGEVCALTGWHRDHARKALRAALTPKPVARERKPRDPVYGEEVIAALRKVWAVLDAPSGKRLAPFLLEIVDRLIACDELDISVETRYRLVRMSAATIDRRLAADRARWQPKGRSLTKPGSLLKAQIPVRTWADWDNAVPGFVEIDLVGHEGGNPAGEFAHTLTVTDIATGWTENRAVRNKAQVWVLAALSEIVAAFPFPVLGIDSDNGSEFINAHLLEFCRRNEITFTRSRPGNKNDGAHVEQKNWAVVRRTVGYHRYTGELQVDLINGIYALLRDQINFFTPQQKLVEKTRDGAKVIKKHDIAKTPFQRLRTDPAVDITDKTTQHDHYLTLNPAATRREILALSDALATEVTTRYFPTKPYTGLTQTDTFHEATNPPTRAS